MKGKPGGWERVVVSRVKTEKNRPVAVGRSLVEIGGAWGLDPVDTCLRLPEEEDTAVSFVGHAMSPENVERVLRHPLVMIGSDGSPCDGHERPAALLPSPPGPRPDRLRGHAAGSGRPGGPDRQVPIEACVATLLRALDAGLNVVDTAPAYEDGYSEEIVGRALRGRRDSVFLVDKIDHLREPVGPQVAASLGRLGVERAAFGPLSEQQLADVRRRAEEAIRGKGRCWWNPQPPPR